MTQKTLDNYSSTGHECPECDREFESEWARNIHCGKVHDYNPSEPEHDYECPSCDYTTDTKVGLKCHHTKSHGESITDATGEYQCPDCNRGFDSKNGLHVHHSKKHDGETLRPTVECSWCGDTKQVTQYRKKEHTNFFCDWGCKGEWLSENRSGPQSPMWKGGKGVYNAFRRELGDDPVAVMNKRARRQAEFRCENCGVSQEDSGYKLPVHHIIPLMSGGDNGDYNLMALCRECHRKADAFIQQYSEFTPILNKDGLPSAKFIGEG